MIEVTQRIGYLVVKDLYFDSNAYIGSMISMK